MKSFSLDWRFRLFWAAGGGFDCAGCEIYEDAEVVEIGEPFFSFPFSSLFFSLVLLFLSFQLENPFCYRSPSFRIPFQI